MLTFILTNFNSLYLRMHWAKFGWNLPRGSWVVAKNEKTLQRQGRKLVIRRATNTTWNLIVLSSNNRFNAKINKVANFGEYLSHADVIHLNRQERQEVCKRLIYIINKCHRWTTVKDNAGLKRLNHYFVEKNPTFNEK